MKVHVVSDVHGAADALATAAIGSDHFVCLGDLVLFLDYHDPSQGILADLFGREHAREYIRLRTANRFDAARTLSADAWTRIGVHDQAERRAVIREQVAAQYDAIFAAMPEPAVLTYGNVDVPDLWAPRLRPGHRVIDGGWIDVEGQRWGFVGGGLHSPMRTPYELSGAHFATVLESLGPVDVLFSHIPPAVPDLTYDVLARRFEIGSTQLADYVRRYQPRYHFFGHVHQPLVARRRIGRTECVNVGHFQAARRPFAVEL